MKRNQQTGRQCKEGTHFREVWQLVLQTVLCKLKGYAENLKVKLINIVPVAKDVFDTYPAEPIVS